MTIHVGQSININSLISSIIKNGTLKAKLNFSKRSTKVKEELNLIKNINHSKGSGQVGAFNQSDSVS